MEPDYWRPANLQKLKMRISPDAMAQTLTSRAEKVKSFTALASMEAKYAASRNQQPLLPPNFATTHTNNLVDMNS